MLKQFKFAEDILLQGITARTQDHALDILKGKPFWIWQEERHKDEFTKSNGQCCANHILGLPIKNGKEFPIFDYEELIFNAIEENQNIWIKKSAALALLLFNPLSCLEGTKFKRVRR